jgi:hypothetical protein
MSLTINQFALALATDFSAGALAALEDEDFIIPACPHYPEYQPGQIKQKYLNGTEQWLGYGWCSFAWESLNADDMAALRTAYEASLNYSQTCWFFRWNGLKCQWQLTSGIMEAPNQQRFVGENPKAFQLTFSKVGFHLNDDDAGSFQTDVWTLVNGGTPFVYGLSEYSNNLWEQ